MLVTIPPDGGARQCHFGRAIGARTGARTGTRASRSPADDVEFWMLATRPIPYTLAMPIHTAQQIYRFARAAGFSPEQAVTMTAVALGESGGNSRAHNPHGEDSRGLWQINMDAHQSWAGELDLYDPVDNAKAAFRVSRGGEDISPWTVTHGGQSARYLQYRHEAQAAAVANGEPQGLGVWTGTSGYGDPLAAGGQGGGDGSVQRFLDAALAQTGDQYDFGAEAQASDPDPELFDCSELVQWAAGRVGVELPDGSWLQYMHLAEQGSVVPVEEAIRTPGALLFSFSTEPTPGGARPSQAHVAISLGDGRTIEARNSKYDVGSFEASTNRFQYAAVIPGLGSGSAGPLGDDMAAFALLDPDSPDTDRDGLTDALEERLGTDSKQADSDQDHLSDGSELQHGTRPDAADTDRDRVSDSMELGLGTDPTNPDSDRDGVIDGAQSSPDAYVDSDMDRLTDELEKILGSRPDRADSDGDGFADGLEYQGGFDPLDPFQNPLSRHAGSNDMDDLGGAGGDQPASHHPLGLDDTQGDDPG
jgi:cell wall-associated NlpC family hydrolase